MSLAHLVYINYLQCYGLTNKSVPTDIEQQSYEGRKGYKGAMKSIVIVIYVGRAKDDRRRWDKARGK